MPEVMIEVKDAFKVYHLGDTEVRALNGVSLKIAAGEFVAIMGPSGSGKSTLMHLLGLLDTPDSGSYRLLGKEVSSLSQDELAGLRSQTIGFVFQQFNLLARTTAAENVTLPLLYGPQRGGGEAEALELLAEVGLGQRTGHKPNELSGGQQQRVAIARALVNKPRIIFADEPTGNLDSTSSEEIMQLLQGLNARGITVILVTHEPEIAAKARRVIRMKDGKVQSDESRRVEGRGDEGTQVQGRVHDPSTPRPSTPRGWLPLRDFAAYFRQAGRALMANKVRSGLSTLGILIGVASVIAMLAIGAGAQATIKKQLSSLGSNLLIITPGSPKTGGVSMGSGGPSRFTVEDAQELKDSLPEVSRASAEVSGRVQVVFRDKNWGTQVTGALPDYAAMRAAQPKYGRFFDDTEVRERARVAVIGLTVARQLFGDQNPLGETIKVNRVIFQVIGILPPKGSSGWRDEDDAMIVPVTTAMYRLLGKTYADTLSVEISEAGKMEEAQGRIISLLRKRLRQADGQEDSFSIRDMSAIQDALSSTTKTLSALLAFIASISLLVGGIGIMNIMLVSVTERTREIGLRKAVGAKGRDILSQFLIEAMVIGMLGGMAGILLGWAASTAVSVAAGWATEMTLSSVVLAVLFSGGTGVVFGFWPAQKASKLNPIEALRYE